MKRHGSHATGRPHMTMPGERATVRVFFLVLRHLGRTTTPLPIQHCLDPEQQLLRRLLRQRRYQLPPRPTVRDAMLGIATLGGHITNNGLPGWLVLGRGFTRFLDAEVGWHLARTEM